ncbi:hypothetical protein AB0J35_24175 [Nonomuraea angiospora]|uniref:hypothetical protein n=1 Tax=Nonomuraea angiospora TaxID=46172 RepID=UPI0034190FFC
MSWGGVEVVVAVDEGAAGDGVVLPEPDGPGGARDSPSGTVGSMPSRARTPLGKDLRQPLKPDRRTSRTASVMP